MGERRAMPSDGDTPAEKADADKQSDPPTEDKPTPPQEDAMTDPVKSEPTKDEAAASPATGAPADKRPTPASPPSKNDDKKPATSYDDGAAYPTSEKDIDVTGDQGSSTATVPGAQIGQEMALIGATLIASAFAITASAEHCDKLGACENEEAWAV